MVDMVKISIVLKLALTITCVTTFFQTSLISSELRAENQSNAVKEVDFVGLRFTDPNWIKSYLPLECPCVLSDEQIRELQSKLLTTQVFQSVDLTLQSLEGEEKRLTISVKEKWTVIPVLRAAYGGGTPLLVAGLYDSHFLGSLYTLGAETRTYGNAPMGGVAWFRAPRFDDGTEYLNFELWRDNRLRSLYNSNDEEIGRIYASALAINADYLSPINEAFPRLQMGVRYSLRDQQDLEWDEEPSARYGLANFNLEKESTQSLLLRLAYDDVQVSQLNFRGLRFLLSGGPVFSENKTRTFW